MNQLKRTVLYDVHVKYGAKLIDFGGWEMPVNFTKIIDEHHAVRKKAGLFDVSHMGKVNITGSEASAYLEKIFTNDISKLENGQAVYGFMCYENGGVVDDLLIYKKDISSYMLVINASNIDKDITWLKDQLREFNVKLENITDECAEIAIQGPLAEAILQRYTKYDLSKIRFFRFKSEILINDELFLVSRTGYTGEDGFEIYGKPENIKKLWVNLLEKENELFPIGLGARDTLRFEASLPLYGHEISKDITPLEAGFGFFVNLNKSFIGKEALEKQKSEGLKRKLVGFELLDKGIPREGYEVTISGEKIGIVTTGYHSPTLGKSIGLALIDAEYASIGKEIEINIRNKPKKARVISKRFLNKKYKK